MFRSHGMKGFSKRCNARGPQQKQCHDITVFYISKSFITCEGQEARPCSEAPVSSNWESWEPQWTPDPRPPQNMTSHSALCSSLQRLELLPGLLEPTQHCKISPWTFSANLEIDTWIQSLSSNPSFLWFDFLDWSAIKRNMSKIGCYYRLLANVISSWNTDTQISLW